MSRSAWKQQSDFHISRLKKHRIPFLYNLSLSPGDIAVLCSAVPWRGGSENKLMMTMMLTMVMVMVMAMMTMMMMVITSPRPQRALPSPASSLASLEDDNFIGITAIIIIIITIFSCKLIFAAFYEPSPSLVRAPIASPVTGPALFTAPTSLPFAQDGDYF